MKTKTYPEISYLSIRQPWAWLIISSYKDIENRNRPWQHRGELLIHASSNAKSLGEDLKWIEEEHGILVPRDELIFGGFVGMVEMVDCVDFHASEWFFGPFGYVVQNPRRIAPIPYKANAGPQKAYDLKLNFLD